MLMRLSAALLLGFVAVAQAAAPTTTAPPTTLLSTQCTTTQFLLGGGVGLAPSCSAVNFGLLPSISANTLLGAVTATTPSALAVPSCSGSTNALTWTTGSGFGCNTISQATSVPGALNLSVYPGVVVGAGQTLATQQANCTNINAAISFAESSGLELDVPAGVYQYNCAGGIVVPPVAASGTGFKFRGNRAGTVFLQMFATSPGAPALTLGDPTGATVFYGLDFDGATVRYGAVQTGFTSAETVTIGAMVNSRISGLGVGQPSNSFPGYDGVLIATGGSPTYISNSADGWYVNGAQRTLLNAANALGAGNNFGNIFLSNGSSGTYGALTGFCLTLGTTAISTETKFNTLDCEWSSGNVALDIENAVGIGIENLHIQGFKSTGAAPILVQTVASDVRIGSMQVQDWLLQSGNITGTPKVFRDASATPSNVQVQSLDFLQTVSGNVTSAFTVMSPDAPADDNGTYAVRQMRFQATAGTFAALVNLDSHMPTTSSAFLTPERVGQYTWGPFGSNVDKAVIPVSATYTQYGQLTGSTIEVPASITSFTITLQAVQGATGNQPVALGTVVHVRRQAGSASGTLTVTDDTPTTLTTNTTAAQDFWYIFNGTHFVTYTPVT